MNTPLKNADTNAIVITGTGCVLPGCDTQEQLWERLLTGKTAVSPYRDAHIKTTLVRKFGRVTTAQDKAASQVVPFKLRRYASPCSQWGVKAASDAIAHASLDLTQMPNDRCGLFTAQGDYLFPSVPSFSRGITKALDHGSLNLPFLTDEFLHHRGMDPFMSIKCLANNMLAIASLTFGTRGDCGAFVQNKSALISALRSAVFSLKHGYSDVALLICAGSYNEVLTLGEMYQQGYLSPCADGATSLRPFDLRRNGTIVGEGAIAFVLETAAHAQKRNVKPLAAVAGIGNVVEKLTDSDCNDIYRRCTEKAMENTDLTFADIDSIVARGMGGFLQDAHEARLLADVQKDHAPLPITCATPIVGSAPACPVDWLTAIAMLQHDCVPPIANLEQPLDKTLQFVYGKPLEYKSRHILSLNVGYTGYHSAVIFSHQ